MKTDWQTKKLGEICDIQNGFAFKSKDYTQVGLRNIRIGNVQVGQITDKSPKFLPKKFSDEYNQFLLNDGDILISLTGDVGRVGKIENNLLPAVLNQRVGRFVAIKKDMDKEFLYKFLDSKNFEELVIRSAFGAAQKNISTQKIKEIEITYPESLSEQKRIVKILNDVFEKVTEAKENAEKNLQNSEDLFNSYLESVLQSVKKKSGEKRLGEVCESVEYGTSAKSKRAGKVAVLRMGNIQNGHIDWSSLVYTDDKDEIRKYLLKHNDVLFNRTNSPELVGKTAIYKGEMPAIFAGYLIRIHRKEKLLDADYLNYFLNSDSAREQGNKVVISSVNQANINGQKLKDYLIPLPSLAEQKAIVKKFDMLNVETKKLKKIYEEKLANLEELKKSVLSKAFHAEL